MKATCFIRFVTCLAAGLVAGLLYAYSCSVVPGLGHLPDREYLAAFASINSAIRNPLFLASFAGTMVLLLVMLCLTARSGCHIQRNVFIAATVIYAAGVFGITFWGNVPLNDHLAAFNWGRATAQNIHALRNHFEKPWNFYHSLRTMASVVCFGLVILSFRYRFHR